MRKQFTKDDVVNKLTKPYSMWAFIAILPLVKPLSLWIANKTDLTPNQITFISFLLSVVSLVLFAIGEPLYLIIGGIFFELSYVFDCVDGTIARLKNSGTYFGELWDHLLDRVKDNGLFIALAYGQYRLSGDVEWLFYGFGIIFVYSIYYTRVIILEITELKHSLKHKKSQGELKESKRKQLLNETFKVKNIKSSIAFLFKHNISPNPAGPETEALIFFFGPILYAVYDPIMLKICIVLGGINLLFISTVRTLYTIIVMRKINNPGIEK